MQPNPSLPAENPLHYYHYNDSEKWSSTEMELFHQALLKHDKDFSAAAQEVCSWRNAFCCILVVVCAVADWYKDDKAMHSVLLCLEEGVRWWVQEAEAAEGQEERVR